MKLESPGGLMSAASDLKRNLHFQSFVEVRYLYSFAVFKETTEALD